MERLSVADVLESAADLIEPEGAWTQGKMARDAGGDPVYFSSPYASCFCAWGALAKALGQLPHCTPASNLFCDTIGTFAVGDWNDAPERAQAEVVAKLREAAALAREQGK